MKKPWYKTLMARIAINVLHILILFILIIVINKLLYGEEKNMDIAWVEAIGLTAIVKISSQESQVIKKSCYHYPD